MLRRGLALALGALMLTVALGPTMASAQEGEDAVGFGMDANAIDEQADAGVPPDYGTFWVGPWTLEHGWSGPAHQMEMMRQADVTPAIHYYYWGDDISVDCVENGCWSDLHNSHKDKQGWQQLADELVDQLHANMQGEPVVIFLETEFNKGGIENHEPFDTYLAEKAHYIKDNYPAAQIVLPFGNWGYHAWSNFDQAAQAADYIGVQGMAGSTRDSLDTYQSLYEDVVYGAETAQNLFGEDVFITDIALSSYPEPEYREHQKNELQEFFDGMDRLKAAGVQAMIYRSWSDANMDLDNYYGEAERHWGLTYGDGEYKPSAHVWIEGVQAERSNASLSHDPSNEDTSTSSTSDGSHDSHGFEATIEVGPNVNEWWVEVYVDASNPVSGVHASVNGGDWQSLSYTDWGSWARSFHVPQGSTVQFQATDHNGATVTSDNVTWLEPDSEPQPEPQPPNASFQAVTEALNVAVDATASTDPDGDNLTYDWTFGDGNTATGPHAQHAYDAEGTYEIQLTVSDGDLTDTATETIAVEEPNQPPTAAFSATTENLTANLDATTSTDPDGDNLTYTWDIDGATASGPQHTATFDQAGDYEVQLTVSDGEFEDTHTQQVAVQAPPLTASFETSQNVNEWWVEVYVDASNPIQQVQASVNGDDWRTLHATDWGTYATSFHAPPGEIQYRVTDEHGQTQTSSPEVWLEPDHPELTASFETSQNVNEWWVEVYVDASNPIQQVQASVNGDDWRTLHATDWGSYADSFYVPYGSDVQYRVVDEHGQAVTSDTFSW